MRAETKANPAATTRQNIHHDSPGVLGQDMTSKDPYILIVCRVCQSPPGDKHEGDGKGSKARRHNY
jgi:hypothetical protein